MEDRRDGRAGSWPEGGCLENVDVVSSMSGKGRMLCVCRLM